MKKLSILALAILSSMPAFAITRTVICQDTSGGERYPLVIQLRGGNAQLFYCADAECPADAEPDETAVLSKSGDSLEYRVLSGHEPAQSSLTITFPDTPGSYPTVLIDGADIGLSCY